MAFLLADRVKETTTTTGTGTLTLAGAQPQFRSFSAAIGNGNTTCYGIVSGNGTDWEVGFGTVGAGTLSRDTILASSNANAAINLSGTSIVFCDNPANQSALLDNLFGSAQGTVLYRGASLWSALAPGTAGQYLQTGGASANPSWATVFSTGDVKVTLKTTADTGWVLFDDGTIGDASSGGTTRANADTSALFTLLWNNTTNANCAVSSGRGASAAADFAAHKTIALPKSLGRALAVSGAGSGLTSRALAQVLGEETHVLTVTEMPVHTHVVSDPTHSHTENGLINVGANNNFNFGGTGSVQSGYTSNVASTGITNQNAGSGGAHNVMQPTTFLNIMVKL